MALKPRSTRLGHEDSGLLRGSEAAGSAVWCRVLNSRWRLRSEPAEATTICPSHGASPIGRAASLLVATPEAGAASSMPPSPLDDALLGSDDVVGARETKSHVQGRFTLRSPRLRASTPQTEEESNLEDAISIPITR